MTSKVTIRSANLYFNVQSKKQADKLCRYANASDDDFEVCYNNTDKEAVLVVQIDILVRTQKEMVGMLGVTSIFGKQLEDRMKYVNENVEYTGSEFVAEF